MYQFGKKHQCRNCEWFKEADDFNWKLLQWADAKKLHWCTAPGNVHRIPHTRCRCQNGQFKVFEGVDSYEDKMKRILAFIYQHTLEQTENFAHNSNGLANYDY